jgi:hypothetical protein
VLADRGVGDGEVGAGLLIEDVGEGREAVWTVAEMR